MGEYLLMEKNSEMTGDQSDYFMALGKLIESVGDARFASNMHKIIAATVSIDFLDLSEWTINEHERRIISVQPLGQESAGHKLMSPPSSPHEILLNRIVEGEVTLLVHLKPTCSAGAACAGAPGFYNCNLVLHKSKKLWAIALYREHHHRDFSLSELSFLKNFSEALLPTLEQHAGAMLSSCMANAENEAFRQGALQLEHDFNEKLSRSKLRLSTREREICLGLLMGSSIRALADKLNVKSSSIETYLKRAAAKLGATGRNGLIKWMAGFSEES
ncbi:helix-turn-helix transcriptional regulator [Pseudomonas syringae]|uniref:helix-turn-helix transcriptional regulator n=1 Tax=Pseudomonas syringae TaxID=317 RepID=UPI00101127EA|nr:helix-turn-helix transcriptional regulator [Pseudomonas syringae]MDC6493583.1 helix-turn-helix transcriptional regulator [Pseudomonas syringae]MDC6536124.1 helix-turn-helix transcriptional regulator [Pseudomonas syringae]RXU09643.1 LuxR family transcriptional regulator [Pseudomonas syringae]